MKVFLPAMAAIVSMVSTDDDIREEYFEFVDFDDFENFIFSRERGCECELGEYGGEFVPIFFANVIHFASDLFDADASL